MCVSGYDLASIALRPREKEEIIDGVKPSFTPQKTRRRMSNWSLGPTMDETESMANDSKCRDVFQTVNLDQTKDGNLKGLPPEKIANPQIRREQHH